MKNKKTIIITVISVIIAILVGISIFFILNNENDASKFKKEYESINGIVREKDQKTIRSIEIDKDNPFIYQTADDIVKRVENKETFAVYFGFSDCPWCRSVIPTLIKVSQDMNIDTIYYVDVKNIRDTMEITENGDFKTTTQGSEGYYNLLKSLNPILNDYVITDKDGNKIKTGTKRISAPNLAIVTHGTPTYLTTGIGSSLTDGYMELTEDMQNETYDIFKEALNKLNGKGGTCNIDAGC